MSTIRGNTKTKHNNGRKNIDRLIGRLKLTSVLIISVQLIVLILVGTIIASSSALKTNPIFNGVRRSYFLVQHGCLEARLSLQRRQGRRLAFSVSSFGFLRNPVTASSEMATPLSKLSFVDIGANLLDERFTEGVYHGKARHDPDWNEMLQRAQEAGVQHIIVTAGTLSESRKALELVRTLRQLNETIHFGCTIGVHPTRCSQEFVNTEGGMSAEEVLGQLQALAIDGQSDKSVVSIGEIGLDYDRLEFCDKETQQIYLEKQLQTMTTASELDHLPLFLHNRNVGSDLVQILQKHACHKRGVVHSFDDTLELALQFIDMGLYIGINGCSLKTPENLEVVKALPLDKILLETDSPYCEIKNTHAGSNFVHTKWDKKADKKFERGFMVKGRNEPCQIVQVAEVIAHVKGISLEEVAEACFQNSLKLYGWEQ